MTKVLEHNEHNKCRRVITQTFDSKGWTGESSHKELGVTFFNICNNQDYYIC